MTQWEKANENSKTEKAKKWVHACSRKNFSIKNITKDTYICSNHFIGFSGPTDLNPDPFTASVSDKDFEKLSKKRKPPKDRASSSLTKPKKRKIENNSTNIESSNDNDIIADDNQYQEQDASLGDGPTTSDSTTQTEPDKLAVIGRIDNVVLKN